MVGVTDSLNYVLFGNPVSQGLFSAASSVARSAGIISPKQNQLGTKAVVQTSKVVSEALPLWRLAGTNLLFVRLAGLSGAGAVILGAYGSHRQYEDDKESRVIFETANRFHFFHSIALMAVPITRRPMITGVLLALGTVLFSGTCYYRAFTGQRKYSQLAPIGGFCLIMAWLSMVV